MKFNFYSSLFDIRSRIFNLDLILPDNTDRKISKSIYQNFSQFAWIHTGELLLEATAAESRQSLQNVLQWYENAGGPLDSARIFKWMVDSVFNYQSDRIEEMYAKNCDYDGTSECTHMQQIQQIITDFVWLCPQRFV